MRFFLEIRTAAGIMRTISPMLTDDLQPFFVVVGAVVVAFVVPVVPVVPAVVPVVLFDVVVAVVPVVLWAVVWAAVVSTVFFTVTEVSFSNLSNKLYIPAVDAVNVVPTG